MECIILCGGSSKRLKPYLPFNKTLAEIKPNTSILEYQINWLTKFDMSHIILAIDQKTYDVLQERNSIILDKTDCSIEREKLGTGGAVYQALDLIEEHLFYLMNVDDILISKTYTPNNLLMVHEKNPSAAGSLLLAKTRFPFGIVKTSDNLVTNFEQKPIIDYRVNAGHYTFTKKSVKKYFSKKGNFEDDVLPKLAKKRLLYFIEYDDEWITINNLKQLEEAIQKLKKLK